MLHRFDPYTWDWTTRSTRSAGFMAADVYRDGDSFFVEIDLPGVDQGDIDVEVDNKALTITAGREYQGSDNRTELVRGRSYGTFTRRYFLGEGLDADHIEATYENGVLRVSVPVLETAQPRKIEVGTVRNALEA